MKKLFIVLLLICLTIPSVVAETVLKQKVIVHFTDVDKEGLYTGEVNNEGKPNGFGVFEASNSSGVRYIVVGYWTNGRQNGESWEAFEDGYQSIGIYDDGSFIVGKYTANAIVVDYNSTINTENEYIPESILDIDWKGLDNSSIISIISGIFLGEPFQLSSNRGYYWINDGLTFCDLPIVTAYAGVGEDGKINALSFFFVQSQYPSGGSITNAMNEDLTVTGLLIDRLNEKIGRTGEISIDNIIQDNEFSKYIELRIKFNYIMNGKVTFLYRWGTDKGISYYGQNNGGLVFFTKYIGN